MSGWLKERMGEGGKGGRGEPDADGAINRAISSLLDTDRATS